MKKLIRYALVLLLFECTAQAQVPKMVAPGLPVIGITRQHLYYLSNFTQVYSASVDDVLFVTYSYNTATVQNNLAEGTITCWLLEEWTDAGRDWLLAKYKGMGLDITGMGQLHYLYYPVKFLYDDPVTLAPYYPWQYEYLINDNGEVCDNKAGIITFVAGTGTYAKIDQENQYGILQLAYALKKKYNL